jgi:uncharacterized protein
MDDGEFQWDDRKAADNLAKHGVAFEVAKEVFRDPFAIEETDDRVEYDEDRFSVIGMARQRLLYIAFTMRGTSIRIISARGAEPHEHRQYHEGNDV